MAGEQNQRQIISCFAPAKINLALHVTGQRPDRYHRLESLVSFCDIGDQLTARSVPSENPGVLISKSGPYASALPEDGENILSSAAEYLGVNERLDGQELHIHLEKNLPVASGIGGGSADAAAAMLIFAKLFEIEMDAALVAGASQVGADVPMCLQSSSLFASGIGEEITRVDGFPNLHLLLVNPGIALL